MSVLAWIDDLFAEALRTGRGPLWLCRSDGLRHRLDIERWSSPPDEADRSLLARCVALGTPVLDIGCGPGRLVSALLENGVPALGVDLSRAAIARTRTRGGAALHRSVFDRIPAEGRWGAALLADGNIGIGGDPAALFTRVAHLLAPGGMLFAEVEPQEMDETDLYHLHDDHGRTGPPFRWSRLGLAAATRSAASAGLTATDSWTVSGRRILAVRR